MPGDLLERTPPKADERIHYGPEPLHFGDLWLPKLAPGQHAPVVVFVHGGWWKAQYGLEYGGFLCQALKQAGIAVWSMEYRRVGDVGGGYPGTFADVAAAFDYLEVLARSYPLDRTRVVVAGHSAGGQLAFWLAGRPHIPPANPLYTLQPKVPIRAVVALAGAVDLRLTIELAGWFTFAHDKQEVLNFMGASPEAAPERYRSGNPGELLPLNVPQFLLQGSEDDQIPPQLPARWAERGHQRGEKVVVDMIAGAGHFDVVDPESRAWPRVLAAIQKSLK